MSEQESQTNTGDGTSTAADQTPVSETSADDRLASGNLLRRTLGDDGVAALKASNWTLTGALLVTLGVVSDLMQIFGPISRWGLIASLIAAAVLGAVIVFRLRGKNACVAPFVSALLMAAVFSIVLVAQESADASEEGVIAAVFPEASAIQRALYARLTSIEASQDEIDAKLDLLIEGFARANPEADPATIEAFRAAAESLATSGNARKRKALADFADGEEERAITDLTRLAEDQTSAASDNAEQAVQTWKEVGALAFSTNTDESIRAYSNAIELTPDDPVTRNQLGLLSRRIGDLTGAETHFRYILESLSVADKEWKAIALGNLGLIEFTRGNLDAAEDFLRRSLALSEELGRKEGMVGQLGNLGVIERTRGNLDAAGDFHRRSLALNEELGRKEGMAIQLGNLGLIEYTRGNLDTAEDFHRRSLALNEEVGRKEGMASDLVIFGLIAYTRGDLDAAEGFHRRSLALNEEVGRKEGMASDLGNLGLIAYTRGDLDAAEDFHRRSLALDEEVGRKEGMASTLGNLGLIEQKRGNLDAAEDFQVRSLALNTELGSKESMASALGNLGLIEQKRGNLDGAEDFHRRSLALSDEVGRKEGMANQLGNLGVIEQRRGNLDAAEDFYRRGLALEEELGRAEGMFSSLANLALIELTRGNLDAACSLWKRSIEIFADIGATTNQSLVQGWIDDSCADLP